MSKANKTATAGPKLDELPFEEAIQRLESIVETMESDELPLEAMITRFEEGTRLAEHCKARLAEAELKIQQLEKRASGEIAAKPVEFGIP